MVDYTDITKYASKAYINALLENEGQARITAEEAITNLGLTSKIAEEVVAEVAEEHSRQSSRLQNRF